MVGSTLGNIRWRKVQEDLLSDQKNIWLHFETDLSWHWEKHNHGAPGITWIQPSNLPLQACLRWLLIYHCQIVWFRCYNRSQHSYRRMQNNYQKSVEVSVQDYFPTTIQNFNDKVVDMETLWQFPCSWGGCNRWMPRFYSVSPRGNQMPATSIITLKTSSQLSWWQLSMQSIASFGQVLVSLETCMILWVCSQLNYGMRLLETM